jgi:hypothetical protein
MAVVGVEPAKSMQVIFAVFAEKFYLRTERP